MISIIVRTARAFVGGDGRAQHSAMFSRSGTAVPAPIACKALPPGRARRLRASWQGEQQRNPRLLDAILATASVMTARQGKRSAQRREQRPAQWGIIPGAKRPPRIFQLVRTL